MSRDRICEQRNDRNSIVQPDAKKKEPSKQDNSAGKSPESEPDRHSQTTATAAAVDSILISPNGSAIRNS